MKIFSKVAVLTAIGLAHFLAPVVSEAKEVRIAMGAAGDGALQKAQRLFAQKIEERTNGEYTGRTFEGTLLNYVEMAQGVAAGVVEIGYWPPAYLPGEFPLTNFATNIGATIVEPVAVGAALSEFIMTCAPCVEEFRRKNQVFQGFSVVSPYIFMTKKRVNDVSDLKGMRIRGFSAFNKLVGQWGAVAVAVPVGEVYQALSTGQLEGNIHLWDIIDTYSLGDVIDYVYDMPIGIYAGNAMFNTNRDFWMSLSEEHKRAFFNSAGDSLAYATVMYLKNNVVLAGNAKKLKVEEVETPASIRTSIETFQSNNVKEVIEAARSDAAIPNSDQMAERVLALIDKWRDLVAGIDAKDVDAVAALYRKELFDKIDLSTLE
jgi:TRAP-type transport system periplasmic protein